MSLSYYIYYRVNPDRATQARQIVEKLQQELRKLTGVQGRLLHRRDDPATWMEVYEGIADEAAFETALEGAVSRCDLAPVLATGSRRVTEIFLPF